MEPHFVLRKRINEFIETVARSPVIGFYPTAVAKYADISVEEAFNYLLELTNPYDDSGALVLKWELRCPDFTCGKVIEISKNIYSENEITCPKCGEEFELQETDFFPRFDINPEYKEFILDEFQKKDKKKQYLTLQAH